MQQTSALLDSKSVSSLLNKRTAIDCVFNTSISSPKIPHPATPSPPLPQYSDGRTPAAVFSVRAMIDLRRNFHPPAVRRIRLDPESVRSTATKLTISPRTRRHRTRSRIIPAINGFPPAAISMHCVWPPSPKALFCRRAALTVNTVRAPLPLQPLQVDAKRLQRLATTRM